MIPVSTCECGALMVPHSQWQKRPALRTRFRYHLGRGLCHRCYDRMRRADALATHERLTRTADEMLDDWVLLRDDGYSVRLAAERIGVTFGALDMALVRAKRRGDPRGSRVPFAHDMGRSA